MGEMSLRRWIEDETQDMRDNVPGVKKRVAEEEAGGMGKRKKVDPVFCGGPGGRGSQ